jgi:predicted O-methyltransferase YrrM
MLIQKYLQNLKQSGKERKIPNISDATAAYILNIIKQNNYTKMLEIGCANGYSTLHWANYFKQQNMGLLHTIDISYPVFIEMLTHAQKCKLLDYVCAIFGNALDVLPRLMHNSFDIIFIDAHKKYTKNFVELCIPLLKTKARSKDSSIKKCALIIDDVIKFEHKMHGLYEYLNESNIKYQIIKIDEDDGILIAYI